MKINKDLLAQAVKQDPTVQYMIDNDLPLDKSTYVGLTTPGLDPENLPAEIEAEIPSIFQDREIEIGYND
jgi:hypothetical protein